MYAEIAGYSHITLYYFVCFHLNCVVVTYVSLISHLWDPTAY